MLACAAPIVIEQRIQVALRQPGVRLAGLNKRIALKMLVLALEGLQAGVNIGSDDWGRFAWQLLAQDVAHAVQAVRQIFQAQLIRKKQGLCPVNIINKDHRVVGCDGRAQV